MVCENRWVVLSFDVSGVLPLGEGTDWLRTKCEARSV